MDKKKLRILGVDLGQASVGLAFYNPVTEMVLPKQALIKKNLKTIFEIMKGFCINEKIDLVVFGLPEGDYEDKSNYNKVKKIAEEFKAIHDVSIDFVDEGFTSFEAEKYLREHGLNLNEEKEKVHSIAAKLILERYLAI